MHKLEAMELLQEQVLETLNQQEVQPLVLESVMPRQETVALQQVQVLAMLSLLVESLTLHKL